MSCVKLLNLRVLFCFIVAHAVTLSLKAQDETPTGQALEERVAALEARVAELEAIVLDSAVPDGIDTAAEKEGESSFFDRFRRRLADANVQTANPWMDQTRWEQVRIGLSQDEVRAILGDPTRRLESLKPRIDMVFFYRARHPAEGNIIEGRVEFLRDRVVRIESPF